MEGRGILRKEIHEHNFFKNGGMEEARKPKKRILMTKISKIKGGQYVITQKIFLDLIFTKVRFNI